MVNSAPLFVRRGHFYLRKSSGSLATFTHDAPRLIAAACSRIPARFQSARLAALGRGNLWPSSGNRIEQLQATVSDGGACNAISATIALKQ